MDKPKKHKQCKHLWKIADIDRDAGGDVYSILLYCENCGEIKHS